MRQWRKKWDNWDIGEMEAVMVIQITQWGEKGETFRDTTTCLFGGKHRAEFFTLSLPPRRGLGTLVDRYPSCY